MRNGEDWTEETYAAAEEAIGYSFRNRELLLCSFTHSSYSNACGGENNERLEFLGDAVLQLVVTELLLTGSRGDEGKLTELRKRLVSRDALTPAAERLGLMRFLRRSGGEENLGGKTPSNLFEAVAAGIYLDGGMAAARAFLERNLVLSKDEDYKSALQEYVQARAEGLPVYTVAEAEGGFTCRVRALGQEAEGRGENKKTAQAHAARALLKLLTERKED